MKRHCKSAPRCPWLKCDNCNGYGKPDGSLWRIPPKSGW